MNELYLKVFLKYGAFSVTDVNRAMTEEENLCDRTYRAHERQESKPEKPATRSLPRHTKQDHKVQNVNFKITTQ